MTANKRLGHFSIQLVQAAWCLFHRSQVAFAGPKEYEAFVQRSCCTIPRNADCLHSSVHMQKETRFESLDHDKKHS